MRYYLVDGQKLTADEYSALLEAQENLPAAEVEEHTAAADEDEQ